VQTSAKADCIIHQLVTIFLFYMHSPGGQGYFTKRAFSGPLDIRSSTKPAENTSTGRLAVAVCWRNAVQIKLRLSGEKS